MEILFKFTFSFKIYHFFLGGIKVPKVLTNFIYNLQDLFSIDC